MIPWGEPFVLVGSDAEVQEAAFRLKRIGYDAPTGFLQGGPAAWKQARLPLGTLTLVDPRDLYRQMQDGTAPIIVDVRLPTEWMGLRIGNVLNIPLNTLFTGGKRLSKDMPVPQPCATRPIAPVWGRLCSRGWGSSAFSTWRVAVKPGLRMVCRPWAQTGASTVQARLPFVPSNSRSASPPLNSSAC